ncbi:DUF6325 family protein [Microbacterium sp. AGC85]
MNDFRYGPVEFYLVGFDGEKPAPGIFSALRDLLDNGTVRLLDLVILARTREGDPEIVELDEEQIPGLEGVRLLAPGLTGDEDIATLGEHVAAGKSAAIVALELAYARGLAARLAEAGGEVIRTERVPAPVVNAVMDILEQEGE